LENPKPDFLGKFDLTFLTKTSNKVPNICFGKVVSLLIGSSYALMHNQVHIQNLLDIRKTLVKAYDALHEGPSTFT
jgi:hypothetical protein